jgi:ATP-dependent DNA helicase RecG
MRWSIENHSFELRPLPGIDQGVYSGLSQEEKMIVNALADGDMVNISDGGLIIGKDWRATKAVFDSLEAKKILGRTPGKARNRHRRYFLRISGNGRTCRTA